jgi:hypothetical protein
VIFVTDTRHQALPHLLMRLDHNQVHVRQSHQVSDTDQDKEATEEGTKGDRQAAQRDHMNASSFCPMHNLAKLSNGQNDCISFRWAKATQYTVSGTATSD